MPGLYDHLLVLAFAVALPVYGFATYPAFERASRDGRPGVRAKGYLETLAIQVVLTTALFFVWQISGRPWSLLGLSLEASTGFWIVLGLGALLLVYLALMAWHLPHASPAQMASVERQLETVQHLMPRTRTELRLAALLSVSAGVSEELLCRGFLLFYLSSWFPTWIAVALGIAAFGIGHAYQGTAGALRCTLTGAVAFGLYLGSGSLLVPVLFHVAVDLQGMWIGHGVMNRKRPVPAVA